MDFQGYGSHIMLNMLLGSKSSVTESSNALFPSFFSSFQNISLAPFACFSVNIHMISEPKCCHRLCCSAALFLLILIPDFVSA